MPNLAVARAAASCAISAACDYAEALEIQQRSGRAAKRGEIPDQLLLRRASARGHHGPQRTRGEPAGAPELLSARGIEFHRTDRGGDVTYHGPGQIVGYPIFDLREWKRDVVAYVRAHRTGVDRYAWRSSDIDSGPRWPARTGVWTEQAERSPPSACTSAAGSLRMVLR